MSTRPNPDELLAQVIHDDSRNRRGTLKIFFGYAAGVGKTFAMLEAAQTYKPKGRDIVVGYVEPHARPETLVLLQGLEQVPVRETEYRGVRLKELDVDAVLARRPAIVLVDELAHTNADGSRHNKRWQDVEELRNVGINVWATLNVQHIESLNDVIGQITGITVKETVPDHVFESADDIELVDITPEELIRRLESGKVYVPEQAQRAVAGFFQKGNLHALRELALRQAARRIHTDVESARRGKAASQPWASSERFLVCVGPSPTTGRVIRTAKRMASAFDAPWLAVSVDIAGTDVSDVTKDQIAEHFRLAEQLGAESVTLSGQRVAETILDYARSRNVTKIFLGKTNQPRWKRLVLGTVVDEIIERSGDIDVYVIHGESDDVRGASRLGSTTPREYVPYLRAAVGVLCGGVIAFLLRKLHVADSEANSVMLFLASVAWVAFRYGRGPAVFASVLAVLAFDYLFVPPYLTFAVDDVQYLVTFGVMLAIGIVISTLTSRLRSQVESARLRERRTSALYELGRQLSSLYGRPFLTGAAGEKLANILGGEIAIYLRTEAGAAEVAFGRESTISLHSLSDAVVAWVIEQSQVAGAGTNTLPAAIAYFVPLVGSQRTLGAIGVRVDNMSLLCEPEQRRLIDAYANLLALAIERDDLAIAAAEARVEAEAEHIRSSLLTSVSHDLKTPLAAITGATSSLLETNSMDSATHRELLETIYEESVRLDRLLENILQMTKLDAGVAQPNKQWHLLQELIGNALRRTRRVLASRAITVDLADDLPLIHVDGLLLEQIFVNLFENVAIHTPTDTPIEVTTRQEEKSLVILVRDFGPGLPPGSERRIFDKFYRATPIADGGRGSGLGLAICDAIAKAHGGSITASNHPQGGAQFLLRLPLPTNAPQVVIE